MRAKLIKAQLPGLLAGWCLYASQPALEALTSFVAWMFVVDDVIDSYSEAGNIAGLEVLSTDLGSAPITSTRAGASSQRLVKILEACTEPSVRAFSELSHTLSTSCDET